MTDETEKGATPTPAPRIRIGKVHTLYAARRALVRIAQAVLDGHVTPRVGNCAIYALTGVGRILEVEVLERRLSELEQRAGALPQVTRSGYAQRH